MLCSNCGSENESGRKFCGECGARLAAVCSACGTANSATAKFCGECAAPLGAGGPASASTAARPGLWPAAAPAVLTEYDSLGLPWRQALGALMLVSTIGAGEAEVRAAAASARETFVRLRAKPFLEMLDAAMSRASDSPGHARPRGASVEAR